MMKYIYISKFNKNEKNILLEMCHCVNFYGKPGTSTVGVIPDLKFTYGRLRTLCMQPFLFNQLSAK